MNLLSKLHLIGLFLIALTLPAPVFSGPLDRGPMQQRYNPAAESMLRVPGVVGMYEEDARASLQQVGLAVDIKRITQKNAQYKGKAGQVVSQVPATGGIAMLGSSVEITVYSPPGRKPHPANNMWGGNNSYGGWSPPPQEGSQQGYEAEAPSGSDSDPGSGWTPPQEGTPAEQEPMAAETEMQPSPRGEGGVSPHGHGKKPRGNDQGQAIVATPAHPRATQVSTSQDEQSDESSQPPIMMSPVTQDATLADSPSDSGSCRSWYAIAVDITAEAQRIAKELGCSAVQPPAMWQACIKHIDKIGKWNAYNIQLKKRWNRLVKKTSWAAIGPRDLTLGKTHKGRLIGTTGRTFVTPVPFNKERISIRLKKKAGKSRTSITVCSYMPGGDRIREWDFESPKGNKNKGQTWEKVLSGMDGKLLSIHLDGKSAADTFQYELWLTAQ